MPMSESELRRRFDVRAERFRHGAIDFELILPESADALIDEREFDTDERLPYWADLWPSARALARFLAERSIPAGRVIELGAGVALPSLTLHARGATVIATDYYADALLFARANAERNGLPPLSTRLLDWREPGSGLGRFELILAADVLYERRNVNALANTLPRLLALGGQVLLADPGRVYLGEFRDRMTEGGWSVAELEVREEVASPASGSVSRVSILSLQDAAANRSHQQSHADAMCSDGKAR